MPNGVIVGEALVVVVQAIMLWAKQKGLSDEECKEFIAEAVKRVEETKPEDLPT